MHKIDLIKLYSKKRALIVDEFPDMRASVRRMLRSFGIEAIDLAASGNEAMTRCREKTYDVIICDYNLTSGKNGLQVLEEIRHCNLLGHRSIFIMVAAEASSAVVFGALEYKPDDYLTKPFTQPALQKRLDRLMLEKLVFSPVYKELEQKNFDSAIEVCEQVIINYPQYAMSAREYQGQALLEAGKLKDAITLYDQVIEEKPVEWAFYGKAQALMGMGKWASAKIVLQERMEENKTNLEAYDALAKVEVALGNTESAQEWVSAAAITSPNAILRQQKLAELADYNEDHEVAEKALRRVMKLENNSCYSSAENAYSLVRLLLKAHTLENEKGKNEKTIESHAIVAKAMKKFGSDISVRMQGDILEQRILSAERGKVAVDVYLEEVHEEYKNIDPLPADLGLELVRAFAAAGNLEKSREILKELAIKYANDETLMEKVDALADEPLTAVAKQNAVRINKVGKTLFDKGKYAQAVKHFTGAVARYPNNVAIKLNLVLAIYKKLKNSPKVKDVEELRHKAESLLASLDSLTKEHSAYSRYRSLQKEMQSLLQKKKAA